MDVSLAVEHLLIAGFPRDRSVGIGRVRQHGAGLIRIAGAASKQQAVVAQVFRFHKQQLKRGVGLEVPGLRQ